MINWLSFYSKLYKIPRFVHKNKKYEEIEQHQEMHQTMNTIFSHLKREKEKFFRDTNNCKTIWVWEKKNTETNSLQVYQSIYGTNLIKNLKFLFVFIEKRFLLAYLPTKADLLKSFSSGISWKFLTF